MNAATSMANHAWHPSAAAVSVRIADFLVRTETERLSLFRLHLQAQVRRVSPLLLDLAAMEGVSLSGAVGLMYPPQDWPWRPLYDAPTMLVRQSQRVKGWLGSPGTKDSGRFRRAFANPGVVIRDVEHPRGRFGIRPAGEVMAFTAAIGPCLLSAFGASAMLKLPEPLPETLLMSMPGRQLDRLVEHPAFVDRSYRVIRVQPDLSDGLPIITFRAPLIPFEMPWPGDEE
jgi:hypothetical protein